eukprot:1081-Heterococcus_DN1.PRE.1
MSTLAHTVVAQMQQKVAVARTDQYIYTTSCRMSRCDTTHYALHAICMSHIRAYTVMHTART